MEVDVNANRTARKWSRREQAGRVLWGVARPLFWVSLWPLWGWRQWLLRLFGARVGGQTQIYPWVRITIPWHNDLGASSAVGGRAIVYALGPITIGERATVSQGAHLCAGAHDLRDASRPLLKLPIRIGDDTWICADAFSGPGVTIGRGAVADARADAVKTLARIVSLLETRRG